MTETELIQQLRQRHIKAFKTLVIDYSEDMLLYAYTLIGSANKSNDIVGRVLYRIQTDGNLEGVEPPLHLYLYGLVKDACMGL
ncbi:MAG TPA: hypothetical protein VK563_13815 [Puia sp.]|nr:hypothetical protein [Puia sp.]